MPGFKKAVLYFSLYLQILNEGHWNIPAADWVLEQLGSSCSGQGREQAWLEEKFGRCWSAFPCFLLRKGFTWEDPLGFRFRHFQLEWDKHPKFSNAGLCRCSEKWPWKTAVELKDWRTKFAYADLNWKALLRWKTVLLGVLVQWFLGICLDSEFISNRPAFVLLPLPFLSHPPPTGNIY